MMNVSRAQRPGFAVDGVAMVETDVRYAGYSAREAAGVYEEIRRRVAAIPGVESAVLTRGLPMQVAGIPLVVEGGAAGPAFVGGGIWAGPGYFETLRIPILYGRAIDERDRRDTPRVAVINESMARTYFGMADAVGRRFRLEQDANASFEVIGVARDTGTADLEGDLVDPTPHLFYRSFAQWDLPPDTVLARTSLDANGLVGAMQHEMRAVNVNLPVISAKTMEQYLEDSLLASKAVAASLGGLGALGLCLAGIGLYAVVRFAVSRRSREIGIRMALGARSQQVVWTVASDVAVLVAVGIGAGLLLSVLVTLALRAVAAPAPGISLYRPTADPAALLTIAVGMAGVGLAAASLPAWRAVRMDPLTALRHE
jgi:ABC-type antimicrobial peptide transport system permease subunit